VCVYVCVYVFVCLIDEVAESGRFLLFVCVCMYVCVYLCFCVVCAWVSLRGIHACMYCMCVCVIDEDA
jgi:hypothetical protein